MFKFDCDVTKNSYEQLSRFQYLSGLFFILFRVRVRVRAVDWAVLGLGRCGIDPFDVTLDILLGTNS